MAGALLFLVLLNYCAGVHSQGTLTQPPSESSSPGQTVKLPCSRSSGGSWGSFHWYQQKPGQRPRFMWYGSSTRGDGIPDRFTGSSSGTNGYLTISNLQAEDEAVYYCANWDYTDSVYVFGGGTQLTVLGQPTASPKVLLYPPSKEEIDSTQKGTLVCLIEDFYPPNIQVTWQAEGREISSGVETTKPTKQNDKYLASSYLSLTESEWKSDKSYTCKVTHEGKDFTKSVKSSECL